MSVDSPPQLFLQQVASGWTGLCYALPTMALSFVYTYQHQLNHPNPHVRASTRHRPASIGTCRACNRELYMSVLLTATTTPRSSYGATACLLMCMFRLIGYTCLSSVCPAPRYLAVAGGRRPPLDDNTLSLSGAGHSIRMASSLSSHYLPHSFFRCHLCTSTLYPGAPRCYLSSRSVLVPHRATFWGRCCCSRCAYGSLHVASHPDPYLLRQLIPS